MSVLDEHNRQHTYGDSMGPPSSVVGVSAQQAINANRPALDAGGSQAPAREPLRGRDHLKLAAWGWAIAAVLAVAAYVVGGFGAVALGLVAFIAAMFGAIFLVGALVSGAKSGGARSSGGHRTPPGA